MQQLPGFKILTQDQLPQKKALKTKGKHLKKPKNQPKRLLLKNHPKIKKVPLVVCSLHFLPYRQLQQTQLGLNAVRCYVLQSKGMVLL